MLHREDLDGALPHRLALYWIVDPFEATLTILVLDGTVYRELGVFGRGAQATSPTLGDIPLDVSAILDTE